MRYPKPPLLELESKNPRIRGQVHGETLRKSICEISQIRIDLMLSEVSFSTKTQVLELARAHLPLLKEFDTDLHEELLGIAEGSKLTPEEIVVLNNYTDMRDIVQSNSNITEEDPGGCSVIFSPFDGQSILGQTWDIAGSALDYVVILKVKDKVEPLNNQLLFSITGCLGMTGLNSQGLGICINNLNSLDAKTGVIWPALVRKVLKTNNVQSASELILKTELGSGHHYSIANEFDFVGIETSGLRKKVTQQGRKQAFFHTNHCLDPEMTITNRIKQGSTTLERYKKLEHLLNEETKISSAFDMFELLGEVSKPKIEDLPDQVATCGAWVMDLKTKSVLSCKGPPSQMHFQNPHHNFSCK